LSTTITTVDQEDLLSIKDELLRHYHHHLQQINLPHQQTDHIDQLIRNPKLREYIFLLTFYFCFISIPHAFFLHQQSIERLGQTIFTSTEERTAY